MLHISYLSSTKQARYVHMLVRGCRTQTYSHNIIMNDIELKNVFIHVWRGVERVFIYTNNGVLYYIYNVEGYERRMLSIYVECLTHYANFFFKMNWIS